MNSHLSPAPLLSAIVRMLLTMPMGQVRSTVESIENAIVQFEHCEVASHVLPTCVTHLRELPALIGEALALELEAVLASQPALREKVQAARDEALSEMARVAQEAAAAAETPPPAEAAPSSAPDITVTEALEAAPLADEVPATQV